MYINNIERETLENENFRKVLFTAQHSQLVAMSLDPLEEIGEETHDKVDQFFRIEKGAGEVIAGGQEKKIGEGDAIVIPAGTKHNLINTSGTDKMKLYTIYSPPEHRDGTVHKTKADAIADTTDHYN